MNISCRELVTFQGPSTPSCPTWIPGDSLFVSSPLLIMKHKETQCLSNSSTSIWTWYEVEMWALVVGEMAGGSITRKTPEGEDWLGPLLARYASSHYDPVRLQQRDE